MSIAALGDHGDELVMFSYGFDTAPTVSFHPM